MVGFEDDRKYLRQAILADSRACCADQGTSTRCHGGGLDLGETRSLDASRLRAGMRVDGVV
jgi:hypothetical protein